MRAALYTTALLVPLCAVTLSQTNILRIASLNFGYTRNADPLDAFEYTCERLDEPYLDECTSMWLSEATRQLFLTCPTDTPTIQVVDIDAGNVRQLIPKINASSAFTSIVGNDDSGGDIRLWVVASRIKNSTVELFRLDEGNIDSFDHIWTFAGPQIATPRKVTPKLDGDKHDFWFTNEHGPHTNGMNRLLSPFLSTGDVSMCRKKACWPVLSGASSPSGIVRGYDGLHYVASSSIGGVGVYEHIYKKGFQKRDHIETEYAIEDLAIDSNGGIYAAAAPNAVLQIMPSENGYSVKKMLQAFHSEVLPSYIQSVVHDPKTDVFYISGHGTPLVKCQHK